MFRTEINFDKKQNEVNYHSNILSIGSCFANTIGNKLKINKFNISINPFGIIYNPISIFELLRNSINNQLKFEDSIVYHNSIWSSLFMHSEYASSDKNELVTKFNIISSNTTKNLKNASTIIITLGTAYIYTHIEKNIDVANCHKLPNNLFEKKLLTMEEIIDSFEKFHKELTYINSNIQIIFTISPVRHLKDGLVNNNLSKSILRVAIDKIIQKHKNVEYFPSFELLIDDLRDYRFYKDDLLHPTPFAETYIWNKFQDTYFNNATKKQILEWTKIISALDHKPFNPTTKEHQQFLENLLLKLQKIPFNCQKEIEIVKKQLI